VGWHATAVVLIGFGGSDCEAVRDGLLAQPVNSLSSLAYVVAAIVVVRRDPRHGVLALALGAVGLGSFLYHGPMPGGAGFVHDGSLVVLAAALVHAAWRRHLRRPPIAALVVGAVAVTLYTLTRTGAALCRPESVLQGHAGWHVLTATALVLWLGSATRTT
jgi:hypothetical protein